MKKFIDPEFDVISIDLSDVIATSTGGETEPEVTLPGCNNDTPWG